MEISVDTAGTGAAQENWSDQFCLPWRLEWRWQPQVSQPPRRPANDTHGFSGPVGRSLNRFPLRVEGEPLLTKGSLCMVVRHGIMKPGAKAQLQGLVPFVESQRVRGGLEWEKVLSKVHHHKAKSKPSFPAPQVTATSAHSFIHSTNVYQVPTMCWA